MGAQLGKEQAAGGPSGYFVGFFKGASSPKHYYLKKVTLILLEDVFTAICRIIFSHEYSNRAGIVAQWQHHMKINTQNKDTVPIYN